MVSFAFRRGRSPVDVHDSSVPEADECGVAAQQAEISGDPLSDLHVTSPWQSTTGSQSCWSEVTMVKSGKTSRPVAFACSCVRWTSLSQFDLYR